MTEFIMTPTNIDLLDSVFRNPYTNKWVIPVLTFNTNYVNPYYGEIDPLNNDPKYQREVVNHFYTRLTEKWLYKEPVFRNLLKFFRIETKNNEGKVYLISDLDNVTKTNDNDKYRKYIYKYIEKYFIKKRFIDKILRRYVKLTHIKWYDLYNNTDALKKLFAHKLKKLISTTIYELQEKKISPDDTFKLSNIKS